MDENDIEVLAVWLRSAARRTGQFDTFRRIIRLAAEDAADTYADEDFFQVRELIGRLAASVDELEREDAQEARMEAGIREYPGVVRGTGNHLADPERTERVHIHISRQNAVGLPFRDGERTPITLVVGSQRYSAHLQSRATYPYVWVCPDLLNSSNETVRLVHVLQGFGINKGDRLVLRLAGNELSVHLA